MSQDNFFTKNEEMLAKSSEKMKIENEIKIEEQKIKNEEQKKNIWPLILFIFSLILLLITTFWAWRTLAKNNIQNQKTKTKNFKSYFEDKKMESETLQKIISTTAVDWQQKNITKANFPNFSVAIPVEWTFENFEGAGNGGYYQDKTPRIFATSLKNGKNAIAFSIRDNVNLNQDLKIFEKKDVVKIGNFFRIFDNSQNLSFYVEKSRVFESGEEFEKLLKCQKQNVNYPENFCKNPANDKILVVGDLIAGFSKGENVENMLPTCQKDVNTQKCSQNLPVFVISTSSDNSVPDEIVKKSTF